MRRLLALPMMVAMAAAAQPSDVTLRVTTESAEYCDHLAGRLPPAPELTLAARNLAQEGQRLCATGHVRTGIAKLRRALRASQPDPRVPTG
ncbi:MAG: hypothetical protein K2X11_15370 [Acetobacteraceae bacterium]|nr:hypothetical protein [Acetobacteraceae bacterium]